MVGGRRSCGWFFVVLLCSGCSSLAELVPWSRASFRADGGFDQQCPEDVKIEPVLPAGWRAVGVASGTYEQSVGDIVYKTPNGKITWCTYSAAIWQKQRSQIAAGEDPARDVSNPPRARLIAAERERVRASVLQGQAVASLEMEARARQIEADYLAAVDAENERVKAEAVLAKQEADALAEIATKRDQRVETLVLLLLAKESLVKLYSADVCVLNMQLREARSELARERKIEHISGAVDLKVLHEVGATIEALNGDIATARGETKRQAGRPALPCAGLVQDVAKCLETGACSDRAGPLAKAHDMLMHVGGTSRDIVDAEAVLRAKLSPAQAQHAERAAAELLSLTH